LITPKILNRRYWRSLALQALTLMALWLLMSGHYDAFHIALGVASVCLVLAMNFRTALSLPESRVEAGSPRWTRIILYLVWLMKEMILSGLYVARVVLTPRMPLSPCLVRFKSAQPNDIAKVILGNSITLTPGTLTLDIDQQEYLVHALTRTTAEGLLNPTMQTKVARLFTDNPGNMVFETQIVTAAADQENGRSPIRDRQ
jgi:multicomponent Na+:H+ antiporter subunit E